MALSKEVLEATVKSMQQACQQELEARFSAETLAGIEFAIVLGERRGEVVTGGTTGGTTGGVAMLSWVSKLATTALKEKG